MRRWIVLFLLVLLGSVQASILPHAGRAQPEQEPGLHLATVDDAVVLSWQAGPMMTDHVDDPENAQQTIEYGGYELPAYLVPLHVPHTRPIIPQPDLVQADPWSGTLTRVDPPVPQRIDGEQRPALAVAPPPTLPDSPVFVLRESVMRGRRLVVLAISPFFSQDGKSYRATSIQATIPGALPLTEETSAITDLFFSTAPNRHSSAPPSTTRVVAAHRVWLPIVGHQRASSDNLWSLPPLNPRANQPALKINVTQAGMQRITGDMLAAGGFDIATLDPAHLQVWHRDIPVAIEVNDNGDGRIDPADDLRFYAPPPGDRWNAGDIYWVTNESSVSTTRMEIRAVEPGAAPLQTSAHTWGEWYQPALYDSTLRGPDGDHWFSTHLRAGPGGEADTLTIPLAAAAPFAPGTSVFTITGSAYTYGPHRMEVSVGGAPQTVTWTGSGDWRHTVTFTHLPQSPLELRLMPGDRPSGIELDRITWELPIQLQAGEYGLTFRSGATAQRYRVEGAATASGLYDISDPTKPVRLGIPPGSSFEFEDQFTQRQYLLVNAAGLRTPQVAGHAPVDLATPLNAEVLYITPAAFRGALEPLVAHRRSQGYTVAVVDVQAIYDTWSYGQVAPEAIRTFLRYAAVHWDTLPVAVTLVGDGTSDPHDYQERNNTNFIPPYLAYVDPWLGETACETCYAQLEGSSPQPDALPDLLIGRLPVKSSAEVTTVVNKIIGYETGPADASWRNRAIYLTDNSYEADGRPDPAGDFMTEADASIALQPATLSIARLSYDPSPMHTEAPWREPDQVRARDRTLALLNQGSGTVTFFGHAHEWQWALTNLAQEPSHLIELFEVDTLTNGDRLPVVLAMTCVSSLFQKPANSGTTIDERMVLHPNGGAVAVWGPTGRGVSYGHGLLQKGFYQQLWDAASPGRAPVGLLAQAGYMELFLRGNCCQSTLRTYVVLGDPLTQVRVGS